MKYYSMLLLMLFCQLQGKTTSVIIPCYPGHAPCLYSLLEAYEQQTVVPNEVVISLSEIQDVDPSIVQALDSRKWLFPVTIVTSPEQKYAGENRNSAVVKSTGSILIYQDADDAPHPQRVEIIKFFFEHHKVDHIMHEYIRLTTPEDEYTIPFFDDLTAIDYARPALFKVTTFTNGNPATSRRVFAKLKWSRSKRAQDVAYNKSVYRSFKKRLTIKAPLLIHRAYLSSLKSEGAVGEEWSLMYRDTAPHDDQLRYPVTWIPEEQAVKSEKSTTLQPCDVTRKRGRSLSEVEQNVAHNARSRRPRGLAKQG